MQTTKNKAGAVKVACWFAMLSCLSSPVTFAIESGIVDIRPYVSATTNYDDNLFRLTSKQQATTLGVTSMSDTTTALTAGVNVAVRLSRQQFLLGLGLSDTKFDSNKRLDFKGTNNNASWNWQLGNHFNGVLSYTESETAPGFQELITVSKNLRTTTRKFGIVNWQFHPSWLAFTSYEQTAFANSNILSQVLNLETDALEAGIQYESAASTRVRLSLRDAETIFPNRSGAVLALLGNANDRKQLNTSVNWSPTNQTRLNATFGLVEIEYPGRSNLNFSGTTQTLGLDYALTTNTNISASVLNDVTESQDARTPFIKTTGFNIRPSWQVTSKLQVGARFSYDEQSFIGSAGVFIPLADRRDETEAFNTFLNYQFSRKLLLQANYANENRSSNVRNLNFITNSISATIRYDF